MPLVPLILFVSTLLACAILVLIAARRKGHDDGGSGDEGGDDGGSGFRLPPRGGPPEPSDYIEPEWWPEFERQLEAYKHKTAGPA